MHYNCLMSIMLYLGHEYVSLYAGVMCDWQTINFDSYTCIRAQLISVPDLLLPITTRHLSSYHNCNKYCRILVRGLQ